jgi:putative hemolysin
MKVDWYTKTVLTVIAGALLYLCVAMTPVGTPISAQPEAQRVVIAGWENEGRRVNLTSTAGLPVVDTGAAGAVGLTMPKAPAAGTAATSSAPRALAAPAPSSSTRIQCQATTKKGSQCSRMANAGARYCWQHGGE